VSAAAERGGNSELSHARRQSTENPAGGGRISFSWVQFSSWKNLSCFTRKSPTLLRPQQPVTQDQDDTIGGRLRARADSDLVTFLESRGRQALAHELKVICAES